MKLGVPIRLLKRLTKPGESTKSHISNWQHNPEHCVNADYSDFTIPQLEQLSRMVDTELSDDETNTIEMRRLRREITYCLNLTDNPFKVKLKSLQSLPETIAVSFAKLKNKWFFRERPDGSFLPMFLEDATYSPGDKRYHTPPSVSLSFMAFSRGKKQTESIYIYQPDISGRTILELFRLKSLEPESSKLVELYQEQLEDFHAYSPMTGSQFLAEGMACPCSEDNSYWWREEKYLNINTTGKPVRVVMDDTGTETEEKSKRRDSDEEKSFVTTNYWRRAGKDEDEENVYHLPQWPYVQIFNFLTDEFMEINASFLTPYVYQTGLKRKLILPEELTSLVEILTQESAMRQSDILKGKANGIIIISTGAPGTGKTLTSEIFSEELKTALYSVQCAQLGTTEEQLEQRLSVVLRRAVRWNAILQLDEGDVYVRKRGNDIQQNAIVGVFLRVLEYFPGILFITSNKRCEDIDDAIMSRATAWLRYSLPGPKLLPRMWRLMADNFSTKLFPEVIAKLVKELPDISGRTVRNIMRLSVLISEREKKPISFELIKKAARFQKTEKQPE